MRQWLSRHPRAADALLATAVFVLTVAGPMRELEGWPPALAPAALLALACAGLVWRRRWPVAVWAWTLAIGLATSLALQGSPFATTPALVAVYTVATRLPMRRAVVVAGVTAVVSIAVILGAGVVFSDRSLSVVASSGLAAAIGIAVRAQRNVLAAAHERALQAELTREDEAQRRVTEERLRIARELHDVVAHHIAVINVQAGAAGHLLDTDPASARQAIAVIRDASRSTLHELGAMVGLLRTPTDGSPTTPAPGLRDLDALVASSTAGGLAVEVTRTGGDIGALPDLVDLTAYRVVQEALTNAHKHGTGAATLLLADDRDELRIQVTNPIDDAAGPSNGTGHGLIGMRERVHAVGGEFAAGTGDHQFVVDVTLPKARP